MPEGWTWDKTLFAGAAQFYARGRVPYPSALPDVFAKALGTDGSGRLLDVGCGPGTVALVVAPQFREVVGIDADEGMIAEATRVSGDPFEADLRSLLSERSPSGFFARRVPYTQLRIWRRPCEERGE